MSDLAFNDCAAEWQVISTGRGGRCAYANIKGTTVATVDFTQDGNAPPPGFAFLDDLLDEFEADPELKEGLAKARSEIGESLEKNGGVSLASLRMKLGLSQTDLAAMLETSQAQISRLETGLQEPGLQVLRRLAGALCVELDTLADLFP